jgi:hypothetical protein
MRVHSLFRAVALLAMALIAPLAFAQDSDTGYALRFHGTGTGDIDRVKIPLSSAVNVGADFTIEFFMRVEPGENSSGACVTGESGWINGNIILDRDVFGAGDYGDYGLSFFAEDGVVAFGVSRGNSGDTLCGATGIADGEWHHIAVTRDGTTGVLTLFVNGILDSSASGPAGDVSYRNGRSTQWPNDRFLVIGAEKHDYDRSAYPSFSGWIDELRISSVVRYKADFVPPTEPFTTDDDTVGLYHFDEGDGDQIADASGTGSHGTRRAGGVSLAPEWSDQTPFTAAAGALTGVSQ